VKLARRKCDDVQFSAEDATRSDFDFLCRVIEAVIERHPNVAFVTIVPIPDETWQEVGKAFIMPVPGTEIKEEELRELCKKHLANYKVPKEFEVRPILPLLPTGKINRLALVAEEKKKREGGA
jgi:fatty-acyl-CoA synthase